MQASSSVLTEASRQWASRPADERFTSLHELHEHLQTQRERSRAVTVYSRRIRAVPADIIDSNNPELTRWTLAGWNTNTTRSRINALARGLEWAWGACSIKGEPHCYARDGGHVVAIASDEWLPAF